MPEKTPKKRAGKTTIQVSDENLARLDAIKTHLEEAYVPYYAKTKTGKASYDDVISWMSFPFFQNTNKAPADRFEGNTFMVNVHKAIIESLEEIDKSEDQDEEDNHEDNRPVGISEPRGRGAGGRCQRPDL